MAQIRYVGPFDAVDVRPDPDIDEWVTVEHGELLEVIDPGPFLEQTENWSPPDGVPAPEAHADPADMTVAEVTAWVDGDPGRAAEALAQEQAGKARSTLIAELEQLATKEDDK